MAQSAYFFDQPQVASSSVNQIIIFGPSQGQQKASRNIFHNKTVQNVRYWVYFTLPRLFHMEWVWNGWNP